MKKTIIALFALAGVAMGETVTVTTDAIPLPTGGTLTHKFISAGTEGWKGLGWSTLNANIKTDLDLLGITTSSSGNYYFLGNGADDSSSSYKTVEISNQKILMTGRQYGAAQDGFYVNVASVSDLLGGNDFSNVTGITLSTTAISSTNASTADTSDDADAWWSLFAINSDGTWSQIRGFGGNGSDLRGGSEVSRDFSLTAGQIATLGEDGKLFAIYRNRYIAKQSLTINSLEYKVTATVPTAAVPEPTTATLSLLALAGLAARRRRR